MIVRNTISAAVQIDAVKGPLEKLGSLKNLFRLKFYTFRTQNDATKHFGQESHNSQIIYDPVIFVVTDEEMSKLANMTYGTETLGKCTFAYFNKVNGKMVAVQTMIFTDCIVRFITEINRNVLKQLRISEIFRNLDLDKESSKLLNFEKYLHTLTNVDDLDFEHEEEEDESRYVLLVLNYVSIELKCTEIDLDGKSTGNVATKIDCFNQEK